VTGLGFPWKPRPWRNLNLNPRAHSRRQLGREENTSDAASLTLQSSQGALDVLRLSVGNRPKGQQARGRSLVATEGDVEFSPRINAKPNLVCASRILSAAAASSRLALVSAARLVDFFRIARI
jgi:hypothetical protein